METRSGRRVRYTASSTTLSSDDDSDQDAQHNLHGFTFSTIPAIEPSSESDDDTHGRARGPSQSVSGSSKRTRVTSPSKSSLAAASRRTKSSRTTHNDDSGSELSSASKLRAEERAVGTHMLSPIERALGHVFVSEAESTESAEPAKPLPAANGQPETVAVSAKAEQEEPGRVSAPRPVSKAQTRTLFGASNNKTPFVASGNKESGVVPVEN